MEKRYRAVNAHAEDTILRVVIKEHWVDLWLGKQQGRDYPRLARLKVDQAKDLAALLSRAGR
jgi:hypothetical protein